MPERATMPTRVPLVRMNGLGNRILIIDMRTTEERVSRDAAISLAKKDETAFDQIMAIHRPQDGSADAFLDIFNTDGSKAEACGNGTRCVAAYLSEATDRSSFVFQTAGGPVSSTISENRDISVDMGIPRFGWRDIPLSEEFHDTRCIEMELGPVGKPILHTPSVVSMGNPHAVFWVDRDPMAYELERFGPLLENHPVFPERANITLAFPLSRFAIRTRTWERGAGLTLACGSAACAAAVSAARTGRTERSVRVEVASSPGEQSLLVDWRDEDDHVVMTGPAEYEWSGTVDPASGHFQRATHTD